ncbi:hypothetical protein GRX01_00300 [Halobaculum sp. WSA2]|uniref:Uncharacterized protein n=1 Tax=Halobaculum saliterrae TaxID=2073113 RepID=A0A6B0SUE3_9EURY|nr:hypothetical protein [Halobaculum saliterrae]MXR39802.1 hypothetical protein [Halobaculum saliterrae]
MSRSGSDSSVYAAAQGREFLRGELEEKPNEWVREFAGLIDDAETLDLLNYYASLWESGLVPDEHGPFLESALARNIIRSASTRMADRAFTEGNVSQMQGMVGLTNRSRDGKDLLTAAAEQLENEGAIGLVLGPPGSGKTATTLDVARTWAARTGGNIIGNTSWDGFDQIVRSDREMLEAMAEVEGQVLAVIDETAQELSGYGQDGPKAETFANALTFIRKKEGSHGPHAKRGSVLMVNHTRKRTAAAFRRLATFAIEKPKRDDPGFARLLETEGGQDTFDDGADFTGLTDTRESYSEHEASEFAIVGADGDDQDDGDDAPDPEEIRRRERVRSYLLDSKPWSDAEGISQKDAAAKAGYGTSWATDRKKEWERGEWNELEDVPEPEEGETG